MPLWGDAASDRGDPARADRREDPEAPGTADRGAPAGRARSGAQQEFWDTGPPVGETSQAPAPSEYEMDQRLAECEFPD